MSTEKIVKNKAKQMLKGNYAAVIAAAVFVAAVIIFVIGAYQALIYGLKLVDVETGKTINGREMTLSVITGVTVGFVFAVSPLINGLYRIFDEIARRGEAGIDALFYYFGGARYLKTLSFNFVTLVFFAVVSYGLDPYAYLSAYTERTLDSLIGFDGTSAALLCSAVVSTAIKIIAYLIFVNYPMLAYANNENSSLRYCTFTMYGFAIRHFGETLKLFFSLIGWLALCLLIVPAFYALPYIMASFAVSAKWLFELEENRGILC